MNNSELHKKALQATGPLLEEKGYICFVDIFMKLGYLSVVDYERWRFKKVTYLEQVIGINLKKIKFVLKSVKENCENGKLKASKTVYKSWGKGPKQLLKFSKSGSENIESIYSTHWLRPEIKKNKHNQSASQDAQKDAHP